MRIKKQFKLRGFKFLSAMSMDFIIGSELISFTVDGHEVYFLKRRMLLKAVNPLQKKVKGLPDIFDNLKLEKRKNITEKLLNPCIELYICTTLDIKSMTETEFNEKIRTAYLEEYLKIESNIFK